VHTHTCIYIRSQFSFFTSQHLMDHVHITIVLITMLKIVLLLDNILTILMSIWTHSSLDRRITLTLTPMTRDGATSLISRGKLKLLKLCSTISWTVPTGWTISSIGFLFSRSDVKTYEQYGIDNEILGSDSDLSRSDIALSVSIHS